MKKILIALLILIAVLVALSIYWQSISPDIDGLEIEANGTLKKLSGKALTQLKLEDFTTSRGDEFRGWKLSNILNLAKMETPEQLTLFSRDGGSLKLNAEESMAAYIVTGSKNNENYFRLIIPTDEFGQRWLKYITKISVKKAG